MFLTATPISLPVGLMLSGSVWSPTPGAAVTVTYDFLQQVPSMLVTPPAYDLAENVDWAPMTAQEQVEVIQAMNAVSAVANITFVASTNSLTANILLGTDDQVTGAYTGYAAGSYLSDGRYLMSQDHIEISNYQGGSLPVLNQFTGFILHELANATGLEDFVVDTSIPAADNDLYYAVQSYDQAKDMYLPPAGIEPTTPQILDILAWQYLYGANENGYTQSTYGVTESHVGNNHTYHFTDDTAPMTVWIGANVSGVNCFDFSACTSPVTIDLTPGTLSGTGQYFDWTSSSDSGPFPYQNVGIAYGTTIQVGVANNQGSTLYADSTGKHENLLIGGTAPDTFVAGNGLDIFIGKGGGSTVGAGDTVEFHDPYADYKIMSTQDGCMVIIDQAPEPKDGTIMLSAGFSTLEFADQSISVPIPISPLTSQLPAIAAADATVVAQAADLPGLLDDLQAYIQNGYINRIELVDGGIPTLSVTAGQLASDAQALAAVVSPYQLQVTLDRAPATVDGPEGITTTAVLPDAASHYQISVAADGSVDVIEGGTLDQLVNVTAIQFSDCQVVVASQTPASPGGVSSAQITALYAAVLDRVPDAGGLAFYEQNAVANPATGITTYAEYFLSSPEYVQNSAHAYAQTAAGDAQFITDTYQNLLHRAPEAGAVDWYQTNVITPILQGQTAGTAAYAQAELVAHATVLAYFSQSPEFLGDVSITAQQPANAQHWLVLV